MGAAVLVVILSSIVVLAAIFHAYTWEELCWAAGNPKRCHAFGAKVASIGYVYYLVFALALAYSEKLREEFGGIWSVLVSLLAAYAILRAFMHLCFWLDQPTSKAPR